MGKMTIIFEDYIEDALRDQIKRRGDLSRIVNEAVRIFLKLPKQQNKPIDVKGKK